MDLDSTLTQPTAGVPGEGRQVVVLEPDAVRRLGSQQIFERSPVLGRAAEGVENLDPRVGGERGLGERRMPPQVDGVAHHPGPRHTVHLDRRVELAGREVDRVRIDGVDPQRQRDRIGCQGVRPRLKCGEGLGVPSPVGAGVGR